MAKKNNDIEARNSPVAWFFMLEKARRDNDFEGAVIAKKKLERLGVKVRYTKKAEASGG